MKVVIVVADGVGDGERRRQNAIDDDVLVFSNSGVEAVRGSERDGLDFLGPIHGAEAAAGLKAPRVRKLPRAGLEEMHLGCLESLSRGGGELDEGGGLVVGGVGEEDHLGEGEHALGIGGEDAVADSDFGEELGGTGRKRDEVGSREAGRGGCG